MPRILLFAGSVYGLTAVAAGAFGAHALRARLSPEMLAAFETGARYQMYHALALVGLFAVRAELSSRTVAASGWLFALGVPLFSGSLYALATGGPRWLGAITPFGGLALMAGWLMMAIGTWRRRRG